MTLNCQRVNILQGTDSLYVSNCVMITVPQSRGREVFFSRVLYGAVFPIGSVRFGAVNRTEPHRRIFALFKTAPHRTAM